MSITGSTSAEPPINPPNHSVEQFLDEIVKSVHPIMAEAFFCAALPHWYDLELFTAIRAIGDERNQGLIPRLEKYSFILPLPDTDKPTFRARDTERCILNKRWISADMANYLAAHRRAHGYWQSYEHNGTGSNGAGLYENGGGSYRAAIDEITHEQNQLYHHYFVDLDSATRELGELFRKYYGDRLLAAIERLLHMASEARDYLRLLQSQDSINREPGERDAGERDAGERDASHVELGHVELGHVELGDDKAGVHGDGKIDSDICDSERSKGADNPTLDLTDLTHLDHLIDHLYARQAQLQGRWSESMEMFQVLLTETGLTPDLVPFVTRGYADSLKETGLYAESIREYKLAVSSFKEQAHARTHQLPDQQDAHLIGHIDLKIEQGLTMINLGEAYIDFALSANVDPSKVIQRDDGWQRVRQVHDFFTALPLVAYLSIYIGRRVWHPSFWRVLDNLDWIIGRLFAKGADQYLRADVLLDTYGNKSYAVLANEKLAFLYLKMGDFGQARALFVNLLEITPSPLSAYHRALVRRGLAEAELALGGPEVARLNLNKSLPILRAYEDVSQTVEAQALLAETFLASDRQSEAVEQFGQVLAHHQQTHNLEKATSIYERLRALVQSGSLKAEDAITAQRLTDQVSTRRYPVRFRSMTTIFTQRLVLILLTLVFVAIPLQTIQLDSRTQIVPEINFSVPPLLQGSDVDLRPNLNIDVTTLSVADVDEIELFFQLSAWIVLGYLLFITVMGVLAIVSTPMHTIQRTMQARILDVDQNGIRFGGEQGKQAVPWQTIRRFVRSDMSMLTSRLRVDDSVTLLASTSGDLLDNQADQTEILKIRGSTTWYTSLIDWLEERLPDESSQQILSYSWLRNWSGLLYGLGLLTFIVLAVCIRLIKSGLLADDLLMVDLPILRYSIFDLYPYFFTMLFIPPMLWFVFRPLRIRSYLSPHSLVPWAVGGIGLTIFAVRVLTEFRPWLTVPDIYPAGVIFVTVVGAAATIWQARDPISQLAVFPFWLRATAALIALFVTIVVGTYVTRDIVAYHHLVNGHFFRDQAQAEASVGQLLRPSSEQLLNSPNESLKQQTLEKKLLEQRLLTSAFDSYKKARVFAEYALPLPWLDQFDIRATQHIGYPKSDQTVWHVATKGIADIAIKLDKTSIKLGESVLPPQALYQSLLEDASDGDKAEFYIAQAITLANQNQQFAQEFGSRATSQRAIDLFTKAIDSSIDGGKLETAAKYRLWRGVARHNLYSSRSLEAKTARENIEADYQSTLNGSTDSKLVVKALVGLGWLHYQSEYQKPSGEQNFAEAFGYFEQARQQNIKSIEAWLGMGYVHYRQANQQIATFNKLGEEARESTEGQRLLRHADRKLRAAELVWLHAQMLDPAEPSIPISLATLHWKLANSDVVRAMVPSKKDLIFRLNNSADQLSTIETDGEKAEEIYDSRLVLKRCAEYKEAINLIDKALNRYEMHGQTDKAVAYSYRTRAQFTWILQHIGCPGAEKRTTIERSIDDYSRAIALDQNEAFYPHMRARLTNQLISISFEAAQETLENQRLLQLEIAPLRIRSLQDMGEALALNPEDDRQADYVPNTYLGSSIKMAFETGYSLLQYDEPQEAVKVYEAAIQTAINYRGHRSEVENAAQSLANRLTTHPSAEGEQIDNALQRTLAILDIKNPDQAFIEAFARLTNGDEGSAFVAFRRALPLAVEEGDIRIVAVALMDLYKMDEIPPDSVIDLFRPPFSQLTRVQKSQSNTDALNLGYIAAAVGKTQTAVYWYAEGIRRSTQGTNNPMNNYAQAKRLSDTWENNGAQLQTMLNHIPDAISVQEALYPELADNGLYWNRWAWSIYFLGQEAFLQGDEKAAKNALVVGQPYADRAAALGTADGDVVHTYYAEGAWSWYHFVRAKQKQDAANYQEALVDYSLAATFSRPQTNRVAIRERAQAAFRAGLMALYIDNDPLAQTWYKNGIKYVANGGGEGDDRDTLQTQLADAITELEDAIKADTTLRSKGNALLLMLAQAQEN